MTNTTSSLIETLHSLDGRDYKGFQLQIYMQAVADCIAIFHEHIASHEALDKAAIAIMYSRPGNGRGSNLALKYAKAALESV